MLFRSVQGDEPEVDPTMLDRLVDRLAKGNEPMATIVTPFGDAEDVADPNVVKAVLSQTGRCLYFSRLPIPHQRDRRAAAQRSEAPDRCPPHYHHLGVYAYRRDFLSVYVNLPATPAEQAEQLEQLRVLEHGHAIAAIITNRAHPGIDTAEQYDAFVERWTNRQA